MLTEVWILSKAYKEMSIKPTINYVNGLFKMREIEPGKSCVSQWCSIFTDIMVYNRMDIINSGELLKAERQRSWHSWVKSGSKQKNPQRETYSPPNKYTSPKGLLIFPSCKGYHNADSLSVPLGNI